jgi:DNA-binding protein Fis
MKKKRVTKNLSNSSLSTVVKKEAKLFIKNMNGNGSTSNMHSLFLNDTERTLIDTVLNYAKEM